MLFFFTKIYNCDVLGHNVKKQCFLKLYLGFRNWTFLKMSIFDFPFYFLEKYYKLVKSNIYPLYFIRNSKHIMKYHVTN